MNWSQEEDRRTQEPPGGLSHSPDPGGSSSAALKEQGGLKLALEPLGGLESVSISCWAD